MQSLLTRRGIVALVAAGFLFSVGAAQDRPTKPELAERDPFVNQIGQNTPNPQQTKRQPRTPQPESKIGETRREVGLNSTAEVIPAPDVRVTGIVAVEGQRTAILQSDQGMTIVSVGQKLADFEVSQISEDSVTFRHSGQDYRVPMETEF
jgi:Tfp pilus assembly protein PilP